MTTGKMTLDVEGMSCSHCENRVKKAVGALDGVKNVSVDLPDKKVTVDYDPKKVGPESVKEAIEEQGYQAVIRQ